MLYESIKNVTFTSYLNDIEMPNYVDPVEEEEQTTDDDGGTHPTDPKKPPVQN